MSYGTFIHNPTEVEAIQVARPWSGVEKAVPRARQVRKGSGAMAYFVISNHGTTEVQRAVEGDWIVKDRNGYLTVVSDEEFRFYYTSYEEWTAVNETHPLTEENDGDGHTVAD